MYEMHWRLRLIKQIAVSVIILLIFKFAIESVNGSDYFKFITNSVTLILFAKLIYYFTFSWRKIDRLYKYYRMFSPNRKPLIHEDPTILLKACHAYIIITYASIATALLDQERLNVQEEQILVLLQEKMSYYSFDSRIVDLRGFQEMPLKAYLTVVTNKKVINFLKLGLDIQEYLSHERLIPPRV